MTIDYEWIFVQFDTAPSKDSFTDVVSTIHWRLNATDETGITASVYGTVSLPDPTNNEFIPYDQITKNLSITWMEENIDVPLLKSNLADQIEAIKNPQVIYKKPPFAEIE